MEKSQVGFSVIQESDSVLDSETGFRNALTGVGGKTDGVPHIPTSPTDVIKEEKESLTFAIPQLYTEYDVCGMEYFVGQFRVTCHIPSSQQHGTKYLALTLVFTGEGISKSLSALQPVLGSICNHQALSLLADTVCTKTPLTSENAVTQKKLSRKVKSLKQKQFCSHLNHGKLSHIFF